MKEPSMPSIDVEDLAEKFWTRLSGDDDEMGPWADADDEEKKEVILMVNFILALAEEDLIKQAIQYVGEKIMGQLEAQAAANAEPAQPTETVELPASTEAFLDDPSTGVTRERQLDPWMEK